ncbi:MAG: acyl-phosphate glycerol 3-phosphate acyltransferase [Bacteroidota bacterium]|jgi:glycerol-3-phosphate acyltransferase PlsY
MTLLFVLLTAYFLGSIPTAVWVGRSFKGIDIREHGSKNAGATNTFRVLGKRYGWLVLLIDVAKGTVAACLPYFLAKTAFSGYKDEFLILQLVGGFTAVVGHVFPIFAQFRGGKGVATSLGIVVGINPPAAAICLSIFLVVFVTSRYVSLGAMISALCFPIVSYFFIHDDTRIMIIFTIVLGTLVIWAHRKNIERLWHGTENRMNLFAKKS